MLLGISYFIFFGLENVSIDQFLWLWMLKIPTTHNRNWTMYNYRAGNEEENGNNLHLLWWGLVRGGGGGKKIKKT